MTPRLFLGIAAGLAESAIAVVSSTPEKLGPEYREWNKVFRHFETYQRTLDRFVCGEILRIETAKLPARIRKMIAKGCSAGLPVRVVVDRSAIADPMTWDIWEAVMSDGARSDTGSGDVTCTVLDIDTESTAAAQRPRIISMHGDTGSASEDGGERVHARDVAGVVAWMQGRGLVTVSPKAREANALAGELDGFNGQPDRKLARALAVALYAGQSMPTGSVSADTPLTDQEQELMSRLEEKWEDEGGDEDEGRME